MKPCILPFLILIFSAIFIGMTFGLEAEAQRGLVACPMGEPCTICQLFETVQRLVNFLLNLMWIAAAIGIMIGGTLILIAGANQSWYELGVRILKGVIIGVVIVLIVWVIVNTVIMFAADAVGAQQPRGFPWPWDKIACPTTDTPPPPPNGPPNGPPPPPSPPPGACDAITRDMCRNPQALASACNAAYPRQNNPRTDQLIACVKRNFERPPGQGGFGRPFRGSIYTYELTNDLCNYTKGREVCGNCAHAVNSCHYGGSPANPEGNRGALAIDWGLGWVTPSERAAAGNALIQSGFDCGPALFKNARCEYGGTTVPCVRADHVHMNVTGCDRN